MRHYKTKSVSEQDIFTTDTTKTKTKNQRRRRVHPVFNDRWTPLFVSIGVYIFSVNFGFVEGISYSILLGVLITIIKNAWRKYFKGTIKGKVVLNQDKISFIPLKNIEVSYSHPLVAPVTPVKTNSFGEFQFERNVPLGRDFTVTAKIGSRKYIHQNVEEIEDVKWFLGLRWLGIPISCGIPKHVDFIVPSNTSL
ncbi:hypothetical protein C6497_08620 [Candidatus Poribacteria bacterium]|nr:MAG: hypothetical protein C6497_08620 [Candidatus Poribacteria bacterium]